MHIVTSPWPYEFSALVASAKKTLRIAAPYFGESIVKTVLRKSNQSVEKSFLVALSEQGVRHGSQSTKSVRLLRKSRRCKIRIAENLHAKLIIADQHSAIVTSSNMTDHGINKNAEMGVYIDEPEAVKTLISEFDRWFGQVGEISDDELAELESIERSSRLMASGKRYGKRIVISRDRSQGTAKRGVAFGWILHHSPTKFGENADYLSPQAELEAEYEPGIDWHWNHAKPPKEQNGVRLLFEWDGEVFGEGTADVVHVHDRDDYNFAFRLSNYKPNTRPVALDKLINMRVYYSLIKLNENVLNKYHRLIGHAKPGK